MNFPSELRLLPSRWWPDSLSLTPSYLHLFLLHPCLLSSSAIVNFVSSSSLSLSLSRCIYKRVFLVSFLLSCSIVWSIFDTAQLLRGIFSDRFLMKYSHSTTKSSFVSQRRLSRLSFGLSSFSLTISPAFVLSRGPFLSALWRSPSYYVFFLAMLSYVKFRTHCIFYDRKVCVAISRF